MDTSIEKGLTVVLKCECNGKEYKTPATYKAHQTTNIHQLFVINKQLKDFEIQTTRLQNENDHLKRLNVLLMDRIQSLQLKW